ncbi:MAG: PilZ domain-containing protein [Alphaproteobacteria bacterium]
MTGADKDQFTTQRAEPRYPLRAGFIEIENRPLPLADLSTRGLGFRAEDPDWFRVGGEFDGFLVLQLVEEQYEMPVQLTVRRIEDGHIGCSMTCVIPHHGETITEFLAKMKNG